MRIKLNFRHSLKPFVDSPQNAINSFVRRLLGQNNEYHDKFSNYSVSSLFGGLIVDNKMTYPNGAYFYISTIDDDFFNKIIYKLIDNNIEMRDMKLINFQIEKFNVHNNYDIIRTISPILLKENNRIITYKDDDFIEVLTKKKQKRNY